MERLALCSRVLYDRRILEQQKEIERLKLRVFWLEYGKRALNDAMQCFNDKFTMCGCLNCIVGGRALKEDGYDTGGDCTFQEAFEHHLDDHGFIVSNNHIGLVDVPFVEGDCDLGDVHFVLYGRGDWVHWSFGRQLWSATSVGDPEILKYGRMVDSLVSLIQ